MVCKTTPSSQNKVIKIKHFFELQNVHLTDV